MIDVKWLSSEEATELLKKLEAEWKAERKEDEEREFLEWAYHHLPEMTEEEVNDMEGENGNLQ